jgi:hypothetical protein
LGTLSFQGIVFSVWLLARHALEINLAAFALDRLARRAG